jgi:hypothetical protein
MADLRIQYSEEMVGANHPTKADTLSRSFLVEHNPDGTHAYQIPAGTKMWFWQSVAPSGWVLITSAPDCLLAVKGGSYAYNVPAGTLAGTWTKPSHQHSDPSHSHNAGTLSGTTGTSNGPSWNVSLKDIGMPNPSHTHNFDVGGHTASANGDVTGSAATTQTWRPHAAVGIICQKS